MSLPSQRSRGAGRASGAGRLLLGLLGLLGGACTEPRSTTPEPPTWQADIAPLFVARCAPCHGGESPEGSYALDSYPGALGTGTDNVPNAIAGDARSVLLTRLTEADHQGFLAGEPDALALLDRWVVEERLAFFHSVVHPPGFVNPADPAFHGREIAAAGFDLAPCRSCHGERYAGGDSQVSCLGCHPATPDACDTCHGTGTGGAPPPSLGTAAALGAHQQHLVGTTTSPAVACNECHLVPETVSAPGHLDTDGRADVAFGPSASARGATPAWDPVTRSCSNVACHAAGIEGGTVPTPGWSQGEEAGACGACHGLPPAVVASGDPHTLSATCEVCHPTAGPQLTIALRELHGDGVVEVAVPVTTCDGCHASPDQPLPFRDTTASSDPTRPGVGAHERHLAEGFFARPFLCADCHAVPATLGAPTHIDAPPAEVQVASGPGYDPATATCVTGCHGFDLDGGPVASPSWIDPDARVVCGGCHGMPPAVARSGAVHPPASECGSCHGQVIDGQFQWVDRTLHVDGLVETTTP